MASLHFLAWENPMRSGALPKVWTLTSTTWNTCVFLPSVLQTFISSSVPFLGVSDKGGKPTMFRAIQEQITYLYRDKHQPLLLAIDEAQYLNNGILNDIKMLMNYGYDSVNRFTLILCGESHLNDILRKPIPWSFASTDHDPLQLWRTGWPRSIRIYPT